MLIFLNKTKNVKKDHLKIILSLLWFVLRYAKCDAHGLRINNEYLHTSIHIFNDQRYKYIQYRKPQLL